MEFRTNIKLQFSKNQIDYESKVILFGSCFSENISKKLAYYKFSTFSNPFGILFNPIAIEHVISNAISNKKYTEDDIFYLNEQWHCFDAHSNLSASSKFHILEKLNNATATTNLQLQQATHLIFTLGTAWVYKLINTNKIVGNCHKIPQKQFEKLLLSTEEISASLTSLLSNLKKINPTCEVIFTVSPVRHLKDGFAENTLSKAHLITALNKILQNSTLKASLHYFPSYEIMLDDLRDYRFYNSDMLHPNEIAVNYIWEIFREAWITEKSLPVMKLIESIQKGLAHKPFNPNSESHQQFLKELNLKIEQLKESHKISF